MLITEIIIRLCVCVSALLLLQILVQDRIYRKMTGHQMGNAHSLTLYVVYVMMGPLFGTHPTPVVPLHEKLIWGSSWYLALQSDISTLWVGPQAWMIWKPQSRLCTVAAHWDTSWHYWKINVILPLPCWKSACHSSQPLCTYPIP